jgi:hypothetical protein
MATELVAAVGADLTVVFERRRGGLREGVDRFTM